MSKKYKQELFAKKKLAVLGLGIENAAFIDFLIKNGIECEITICDIRPEKELKERMDRISEALYKSKKVEIKLNIMVITLIQKILILNYILKMKSLPIRF